MTTEKKMFSTRINPDLIKSLKHMSVDVEKPIGELLEEAISEYLKRHDADQES